MRKQKDLFGNKTQSTYDKLVDNLQKHDNRTLKNRVERLKFLNTICPSNISMLGDMESIFILQEARLTFLNGAFMLQFFYAKLLLSAGLLYISHQKKRIVTSQRR